jgi:ABC-2 type transport system permease protein/lipopolysaccharide transport system permease protein
MTETPANAPGSLFKQFRAGTNTRNRLLAMDDIFNGARRAPLWLVMGSQDVRQRYRRSRIGPFWITLSMGVTVAALGVLYGVLFQQPLHEYLPYLAAGFVVWGLIAGLITDGSKAFIESEGLIRQLAAPLSIYVYREVWGNLLIFLHNLVVYALVVLMFQSLPGPVVLLAIPGVVIVLLNGVWLGLLLGLVSARFRDVPQILASVVQVMFFITPILWKVDMLPGRALLLEANPFYHLLEVVRAPLLGSLPAVESWVFTGFLTAGGWAAALIAYSVWRWRIAYWV